MQGRDGGDGVLSARGKGRRQHLIVLQTSVGLSASFVFRDSRIRFLVHVAIMNTTPNIDILGRLLAQPTDDFG